MRLTRNQNSLMTLCTLDNIENSLEIGMVVLVAKGIHLS